MTKLSRNQVDGEKGKKVTEKLRGLEGPWRQQSDREEWLTDGEGCSSAGNEWDGSLGTIGARNHFAEIQVVESSSVTSVDGLSLHDNEVVLLVHSGSRGYGGYVLKKYTSESHVSLEDYMKEHDKTCRWVNFNRDLISPRFLSCLEPGEEAWEIGRNPPIEEDLDHKIIDQVRAKIQERKSLTFGITT